MQYVLLTAAIVSEVTGTLALRVAAGGRHLFYGVVVVGYVVAFTLLSASLQHGMPLGIAYGIWAAAGVALTAAASRILFREPLTPTMLAGMALLALTALIAIAFWDSYRWQALAAITVVYAIAALVCGWKVRQGLRNAPLIFQATLTEFEKDRELFRKR